MDQTMNQRGFSLIEVLIALTIFAIFITTFLTAQGFNITDSINLKEELVVTNLAEYKINQIMLEPPEFNEALNNRRDKNDFDLEGYKNYSYEVLYKKIVVPDFTQLISAPKEGEEEETASPDQSNANIQKIVMEKMKENIEKIIWQVQVKVTNKETGFNFTVSTWLTNSKAKIELNLGI